MFKVCAHYNGTTILLDEFETKEEADEFMQHNYVLTYSDELDNCQEDELIYVDEMFIDDSEDLPFSEYTPPNYSLEELEEMPF